MTTHIFRTCPDTVIRTTSHFVLASGEVLKPWICHLDSNFDYPLIFLNTQVVSEDDGFTFVDLAITKPKTNRRGRSGKHICRDYLAFYFNFDAKRQICPRSPRRFERSALTMGFHLSRIS